MRPIERAIADLEAVIGQIQQIEETQANRFSLDYSFHTLDRVIRDLKILRR